VRDENETKLIARWDASPRWTSFISWTLHTHSIIGLLTEARNTGEVKSNITDNESAKMTTSKGKLQGYNGVASVDKKHQITIDVQAMSVG